MKIAICQVNTITGNIAHNTRLIADAIARAAAGGAGLALFHELAVTGYPPKDLLEYSSFVAGAHDALGTLQAACREHGIAAVVGTVHTNLFGGKKELLNAAACLMPSGEVRFAFKKLLPTYDVFDEHRYFQACPPDAPPLILDLPDADQPAGVLRVGISICEDIWNDSEFWKGERAYEHDPIEMIVAAGADIIVNISASPFVLGKPALRHRMMSHTARRWAKPVILVNQVGGCDQVIFDGGSEAVMPNGDVAGWCGWFEGRDLSILDTNAAAHDPAFDAELERFESPVTAVHAALRLGLRDYLAKTGFTRVVVGNSGGIDSAVVLALATNFLGSDAVISVSMPGPFTSEATRSDAAELAGRLGVRHIEVPITAPFDAFRMTLSVGAGSVEEFLFDGDRENISHLADENLQARIRGVILMWISNAFKDHPTLVLSTGNKSELAVGYCTLYGDMAGGLALISDVPKMMVYSLARHLNALMGNPIPESILDREPTAELAAGQKDTDSLPPYPVLDEIIRLHVEERRSAQEIVDAGAGDMALVSRVLAMIDRAEYKRQQAAPGLKVTSKAFGFGRRMPIARG